MRTLIGLFKHYWNLILFIILLAISFNLIAKRNNVQSVDIINSSSSFVGFFYNTQNSIVHYFQLGRMNDSLLAENAALRASVNENLYIDTFQNVIKTIAVTGIDSAKIKNLILNDSTPVDSTIRKVNQRKIIKYASYEYIPARVINNSIADDRMNFITLNRGKSDGIEINMSVITSNGIVGRVVNVSNNYATVLSILSEGRSYNAKLMDGTLGSIQWDKGSSNSVTMYKIPKIVDVQVGDTVFTTGHSIFPENVMIGTVASVTLDKKSNANNVKILLSTNFRKLQYVYVMKNALSDEKMKLEEETKVKNSISN